MTLDGILQTVFESARRLITTVDGLLALGALGTAAQITYLVLCMAPSAIKIVRLAG